MGAAPRGKPGWPLFAFCTPSIDRVRIVSTASRSRSVKLGIVRQLECRRATQAARDYRAADGRNRRATRTHWAASGTSLQEITPCRTIGDVVRRAAPITIRAFGLLICLALLCSSFVPTAGSQEATGLDSVRATY